MLQERETGLFATPAQLQETAAIARAVFEEVAESWSRLAVGLLAREGVAAADGLPERLGAEAARVLDQVASSLEGAGTGAGPLTGLLPELPPVAAYRAWGLLTDCLLTAVAARLPDDWPARVGIDLHRRIAAAVGRATGLTPGELADGLEAESLVSRARLGRARDDLLSAGEQERARIARDLHDALAQTLSAAHIQTGFALEAVSGAPSPALGEILRARRLIGQALGQAREIIYDLRPAALERLGLEGALRDWTEQAFAGRGPAVSLSLEGDASGLAPRIELALFRLLQEALSNARRHAEATAVALSVTVADRRVLAEVRDDGRGFDPERLARAGGTHCGLSFMRQRAAALGGSVEVISAPAAGTTVTIELPR